MKKNLLTSCLLLFSACCLNTFAQTYTNPILHADYSDPDVIRVGADFYLTSSSFNQVPGLPVLHSQDLVHWTIIGHVFNKQPPFARFDSVQNGGGVWAPAIRYHHHQFYIYYPDPDLGIWMVKADHPAGPWTDPVLVKKAKGWIDPCPLWDDDGKAYLVNGMAASRSGISTQLILSRMSDDGSKLLDEGTIIYDGHPKNPTIEGPKIYKRQGWYYILAPAGGVGKGWQLALRSKHIYGPYEEKVVLEQGSSPTNGPHQGGWVDTQTGESWFIHFQDKDAYGRILHLEPVKWVNGWPMMGIDKDGNGIGEPVTTYKLPDTGKHPLVKMQESDEFNGSALGLQWQWPANPQSGWALPAGPAYGYLRLFAVPAVQSGPNAYTTLRNMLTQKFPAENFSVTTKFTFTARAENEEAGLIISGADYAYLSVKKNGNDLVLSQTICKNADRGQPERKLAEKIVEGTTFYFRVKVQHTDPASAGFKAMNTAVTTPSGNASCSFSYSTDGLNFIPAGEVFPAKMGRWIGSKVGIFATSKGRMNEMGTADFDWFRVTH